MCKYLKSRTRKKMEEFNREWHFSSMISLYREVRGRGEGDMKRVGEGEAQVRRERKKKRG